MKINWMNILKLVLLMQIGIIVVSIAGHYAGIPSNSHFYDITGAITGFTLGFYGPPIITFNKENPNGRNDAK